MLEPERIIRLEDGAVVLLDQRRLPDEDVDLVCRSSAEVAEAIRTLAVRGAPAIGIAAAYGYALAARSGEDLDAAVSTLAGSRPTAVNLAWALEEMRRWDGDPAERARQIHAEEVERCREMSVHAAALFEPGTRALTHCNAGGLATGGYGTAVGALRAAWERGLLEHVFVDETRPLLQGARLTAWELEEAGIPHSVIADSAAASMMARGEVDVVVTGADRIAANGDTANKIGTYSLAVLAAHHGIPFYVVAPSSTVDLATATGAGIPIEERAGDEVTARFAGAQPGLRRHPRRPDRRDRHRGRRPPRAVRGLARRPRGGMRAIILAAGYATRLRPLTDSIPKQLLPVGGRPMLDWVCDRVAEVTDNVELVTNARFADDFREWAKRRGGVTVHDDGTVSNEDRLGAIGDIAFVLERIGAGDDLLVIAGDNLFDFALGDFVAFAAGRASASAVAVYDCGDLELATHYGVVDRTRTTASSGSRRSRPSRAARWSRPRPTSTRGSTSRSSRATSTRAIPRTSRGV